MNTAKRVIDDIEDHRDPITGAPDSHPVETGMGAAAFGTLGALVGTVVGPLGTIAGAAIGSAIGGVIGHNAGENAEHAEQVEQADRLIAGNEAAAHLDTTPTDLYGRIEPDLTRDFAQRPYASSADFDTYQPAYRYGAEAYQTHGPRGWSEELETDLRTGWEKTQDATHLGYDRAKDAIRDAWNAAERSIH